MNFEKLRHGYIKENGTEMIQQTFAKKTTTIIIF